jgi:hypothetical protein
MFELIATGLIVLAFYLLIRFGALTAAALAGSRHRAYRQLAAQYGGRCESRGLVDPPTVSFVHNGSSCRVGLAPVIAGQPSAPRTRVVARFGRGLPLRMELLPVARPAPPQPPRGTRPTLVGIPEFDRGYLVQANDPDIVRELLGAPHVRESIEGLRRLAPPGGILVSINPERLLVQVDRNLGLQATALHTAVRHALAIHDWLQTSVAARLAEGVSIVRVGPADEHEAGPPKCEVCGDPISGAHVSCTLCRTPSHRDCWTFVGGCSTFGCSSKTCIPA